MICHVVIRGRVQGVGFRDWTQRAALARGVDGWVRNRRDGMVEAVFSGDPATVSKLLADCQAGPPAARVETIEELAAAVDDLALRRPGERFSVLPTA